MNKLTVLLSIWKHCGGGGEGGLARIDEKRSTGYSVLFFPRSAFVNESPSCRCLRAVFTSGLTSATGEDCPPPDPLLVRLCAPAPTTAPLQPIGAAQRRD